MEGEASGTITVSIGCGNPKTRPIYLWDGDAFEVKVTRTPDELAWRVFATSGENDINSPVEHGVSPPSTLPDGTETQLTPDIEYEVKVSRISGESGSRKFTIQP